MAIRVSNVDVLDIFQEKKLVKVCAPMVRYSKLQFRNLVKLYNCDLMFTPMILADSFCKSDKARKNEFTTNSIDTPTIIQLAANTVHDFVGAAYMAAPYCSGVDLNCGCPQSWAKELDLGCALLRKPELIYDLVRQCKNRLATPFTVSVKMRVLSDAKETVEISRQLEKCNVSFLTVHARTPYQSVGEIDRYSLKLVNDTCKIPIIANGGVTTLKDCVELQDYTGCKGIMAANGILTNPTLFSGSSTTSRDCIQNWLDICYNSTLTLSSYEKEFVTPSLTIREKPYNLTFQCFHHHLVFMLEKVLTKKQRQVFNNLKTFRDVLQFIENHFGIQPKLYDREKFRKTVSVDMDYLNRDMIYKNLKAAADVIGEDDCVRFVYNSDGNLFQSRINHVDCDLSNMFLENG